MVRGDRTRRQGRPGTVMGAVTARALATGAVSAIARHAPPDTGTVLVDASFLPEWAPHAAIWIGSDEHVRDTPGRAAIGSAMIRSLAPYGTVELRVPNEALEDHAGTLLAEQYPDREIVQIHPLAIDWRGGGMHLPPRQERWIGE